MNIARKVDSKKACRCWRSCKHGWRKPGHKRRRKMHWAKSSVTWPATGSSWCATPRPVTCRSTTIRPSVRSVLSLSGARMDCSTTRPETRRPALNFTVWLRRPKPTANRPLRGCHRYRRWRVTKPCCLGVGCLLACASHRQARRLFLSRWGSWSAYEHSAKPFKWSRTAEAIISEYIMRRQM